MSWVRVLRHEPSDVGGGLIAFDVVHRDFLRIYLDDHVLPFAQRFAMLAREHHEVLASGKGFLSGLGAGTADFASLEPRTKTTLPPVVVPPTFARRTAARLVGRRR